MSYTGKSPPAGLSPNSRWSWLLAAYERMKGSSGHYDQVGGEQVFVNGRSDLWHPAEKLKYMSHTSHSPVYLARYNRSRQHEFKKLLPESIAKLDNWCAAGGFDADNNDDDETTESETDSVAEAEEEAEVDKDADDFAIFEIDDGADDFDRTEEATVISGDSAKAAAGTFSAGTMTGLTEGEAEAEPGAADEQETGEVDNEVDPVVRRLVAELVHRVAKAHESVRLVRLRLASPKKRG